MATPEPQAPPGSTISARNAIAVVPSDSADLANISRAIYIGGAGNLQVTLAADADGTSVVLTGVTAGAIYPLRVKRVWAASTTATLILALN